MVSELEKSNITLIAFSSMEKLYNEIFSPHENQYIFDEYNAIGWSGYVYIHLFLKFQITIEALFYVIPVEEMLSLFKLFHEMSITQMEEYYREKLKFSLLDIVMKAKKISNSDLSKKTGISTATINALRYNKRDISKLESNKLLLIANALNVKMETLLPSIHLVLSH